MPWTAGVDVATLDVETAAAWNLLLGATGSLMQTMHLVANVATPTSTTSTSATDLVTIGSLSIPVTAAFLVVINYRKQALAAQPGGFGIKLNATTVIEAASAGQALGLFSSTNQAEDGIGLMWFSPRSAATYLCGVVGMYATKISASGGNAISPALTGSPLSAVVPNATITSVIIRAINTTTSNAVEVTSVQVYQMGY